MNRREFLSPATLVQACHEKAEAHAARKAARTNDLFLRAMAQGIDPATVNPEQLPELLGLSKGENETGH